MRVAVFGAGGVGGYFGGRLAQAGAAEVSMIARGEHLHAIQEYGLCVESGAGDFVARPVQASADPAAIGPVDAVLLAVKSWQLDEALSQIGPLLGPETAVVPLLNGVEAPSQIAAALGAQHALGGLCQIIASVAAPGLIRHDGIEPYIALGELDKQVSPRAEALRAAFAAAGVQAEIPADIMVALWAKFALIVTWAGIGALTRAPIGVWRALPDTLALAEQSLQEVVAVANASGVRLSKATVERTLAFIAEVPETGTASMQRDIVAGRPSELEALNGAVVRLGQVAGLETPLHSMIYACLLPQEQAARAAIR